MTVISIRFTAGGYHATPWGHHVNEGAAEWPPSPWRLMRALIASWKMTMPEISEDRMQRLISALSSPPDFRLPPATLAHTRHYMPLYGATRSSKTMVLDAYVALSRQEPVLVIWKGDLPVEDRDLLGRLLANLPYFGRRESWCQAGLVDEGEPDCLWMSHGRTNPEQCEPVRVLVPAPGVTLAELMVDTGDLRGERLKIDPPGSEWALYAVRRGALSLAPTPVRRPEVRGSPLLARYALDSVPLPPVTATVRIAELARKAAMAQYGRINEGQVSPVLTGRDEEKAPLKGNKHAYYLPTDDDSDGRLDHLTVYAPGGLGERECEALARINALVARESGTEIRVLLLGFSRSVEDSSLGDFFRPSETWRSATPFVLSRHPKRYRSGAVKRDQAGYQADGPEAQILREWGIRRGTEPGLPEITGIERVPDLRVRGRRLSWLDFRCARSSSSAPPPVATAGGFRIRFARPTRGPIALGYAAHYGLGLFRPEAGRETEPHDGTRLVAGDLD
ncbi:MAG: type I-U CRISPR-associated protein Cas5/Cas6 [Firmicutes bacterium]|nr:type I-U CRISPR-associated protein Cas5/Cas6 [Bacillota bacterium]